MSVLVSLSGNWLSWFPQPTPPHLQIFSRLSEIVGQGFALQSLFMADDPQLVRTDKGEISLGGNHPLSQEPARLHYWSAQCQFVLFSPTLLLSLLHDSSLWYVRKQKRKLYGILRFSWTLFPWFILSWGCIARISPWFYDRSSYTLNYWSGILAELMHLSAKKKKEKIFGNSS